MKKLKNLISRTYKELNMLDWINAERNIDLEIHHYEIFSYYCELIKLLNEIKNPNLNSNIVYNKLK